MFVDTLFILSWILLLPEIGTRINLDPWFRQLVDQCVGDQASKQSRFWHQLRPDVAYARLKWVQWLYLYVEELGEFVPHYQQTEWLFSKADMSIPLFFYVFPMLLLVVHHDHFEVGSQQGYGHILIWTHGKQRTKLRVLPILIVFTLRYQPTELFTIKYAGGLDIYISFPMAADLKVNDIDLIHIIKLNG